jgi:hypothetical protein
MPLPLTVSSSIGRRQSQFAKVLFAAYINGQMLALFHQANKPRDLRDIRPLEVKLGTLIFDDLRTDFGVLARPPLLFENKILSFFSAQQWWLCDRR